ncbi:MAG: hypothetical protein ACOX2N_03650 [Peptococcia bacterium]
MESSLDRDINFKDKDINQQIKGKGIGLKTLFYLLMILNLGIGNISAGYLYFFTSATSLVALISTFIMMVGFLSLFRTNIFVEKNLFLIQIFYFLSAFITAIINRRAVEIALSSLFLAITPCLICILAIALTSKN